MDNTKKKGVLAYVLEDHPDRFVMQHAIASLDPRTAIEGVLAHVNDTHAARARKLLGKVLEGRGELDRNGAYLQQEQIQLKNGVKGVLTVLPTEII